MSKKAAAFLIALLFFALVAQGGSSDPRPQETTSKRRATDSHVAGFRPTWWPPVELQLPAERAYFYWMTYKAADGASGITTPTRVQGPTGKLDFQALGAKPKDVVLSVLDSKTGNLALRPLKQADGKWPDSIVVKSGEFDHVRDVRVVVVSTKGRPVQSALVELADADNKTASKIITPASRGVAQFEDVAAGTVAVKVTCAGRKSINDVDVPLKRTTVEFSTEVPVPGDVPTLSPQPAGAQGAAKPAGRAPSGPVAVIQTVLGLVFLGLLVYVIVMFGRMKKITLADALKKAGVTLPGETDGQGAAAPAQQQVDPTICPFCGQKKDPVTGACACTVAQVPPSAASGPRLIGIAGPYMGRVFELNTDVCTVGREAGNAIALVDDATASRRHSSILRQDGQYLIRDEGSANGTMVNGVRITEPKAMSPGDEIQIGSSRFRFER